MSSIDKSALIELLTNGQHRSMLMGKQLTLAFAGLYIASTNPQARNLLVWEKANAYPRYYIPIESLHPSIKELLSGGTASSGSGHSNGDGKKVVKLEQLETIKGKGTDSTALIERLSIGNRATTWVRFTEGPLMGFVRFERAEIDAWFENGALFAGIRNPYKRIETTPIASHIQIRIDGNVVAEADVAVQLNESGLNDAYYIPATSIKDWSSLEHSDYRSECPYKSEAWYYHLTVGGKIRENAIWYYMYPTSESAGVRGFVSFMDGPGVDIIVNGVKINVDGQIKSIHTSDAASVVVNNRTLDIREVNFERKPMAQA